VYNYTYELQFLSSLLLTVCIEFFVVFALVKYYFKRSYSLKAFLFAGLLPSVATLPYAWFIFPMLFPHNHLAYVYFTEITVSIIEVFIIAHLLKLPIKQGFIISFAANMSSFFIG
jgi:hypothetical protein